MAAFIDEHRDAYGVEPICRVLPIAPSSYCERAARRRDPGQRSARSQRDEGLEPEVMRVFAENFGVYDVRKLWRQMKREEFGVARCSVERLMRDLGLQDVIHGKPVRTRISDKAAPCPLDHVNRQFRTPALNMPWSPSLLCSDVGRVCTCGLRVRRLRFAISWAGGSAAPPAPASCWMPSSKPYTIAACSSRRSRSPQR